MISETLNETSSEEPAMTQMELPLDNQPETTETPVEAKPKRTSRRLAKAKQEEIQIEVESEPTTGEDISSELEKLREQLKAVEGERDKLASECSSLNDTVKNLQEEVKITPKKLAKVVQEMGIAPLAIGREKTKKMTMEAYNAMSDSQRRDWQRKNRSDYLEMMHSVKLGLN